LQHRFHPRGQIVARRHVEWNAGIANLALGPHDPLGQRRRRHQKRAIGPLMFPIARMNGVDEIYYAIVAILAMSLGLFCPPFGVGFYITCAIGGADPNKAMKFLWPYLAVLFLGVVLIAAVPWLSTGFLK
jgi:hypothetical protein